MITIKITGGATFKVAFYQNMNVQDALEEIIDDPANKGSFTFMIQYYGKTLGYLVDMINGTYDTAMASNNSGVPYFFWDFILNHHQSKKGIDNVILKDGDEVGFKFEMYIPKKHVSTILESKFQAKTSLK